MRTGLATAGAYFRGLAMNMRSISSRGASYSTRLDTPHTPADADDIDCADWGITAQEWSQAIEVALQAKQASG